jgi:thioredoxin reductase (NADPH)
MKDLVIIGAGPAGLAAAREAKERDLDFVVLEKGVVADTIHQFPVGKPLFSTPNELELAPGALKCRAEKPTREEVLTHYARYVVEANLPVHTGEAVVSIAPGRDGVRVSTARAEYGARAVLVATGINGFRKHLNVPGESDERVQYRFVEAFSYAGRRIVVAGSGNSAGEAALFLEEVGAHVTLAMRRKGFERDPEAGKAEIKWWVRDPIVELVGRGKIDLRFATRVAEITPSTAVLESDSGERDEVPCDMVFALLGTSPDLRLLREAGVEIGADGVPVYDDATFETNVPGIYVAGHITRERHMKGALETAPRVVARIAEALAVARPSA